MNHVHQPHIVFMRDIPPAIRVAMEFLTWSLAKESPRPMFDGTRSDPIELTDDELTTKNFALRLLNTYFCHPHQLNDFFPVPPAFSATDDPPHQPQPVPKN